MANKILPEGLERRVEDYGLITGSSGYVDDLKPTASRPTLLYMSVVRSPYAHAAIKTINLEAARAVPGVVAAFTAEEIAGPLRQMDTMPIPGMKKPERHPMAINKVRYVGDPVAVVVAENRYVAEDARNLVEVEYQPLPAVADPEVALQPEAPLLYDELGSNQIFDFESGGGDIEAAFRAADRVIKLRVVNQRVAPSSMEPRACMFDFNPENGEMWAWVSSQSVFRVRETLAAFLKIDKSKIHVRNAEVGGGFGSKTTFVGEEIVAAALAQKLGRPVKWIESRSENLQAQTHGRGQINYIEAAIDNAGRLLGLRVNIIADLGAFMAGSTGMVPTGTPRMLNGPYQIQAIASRVVGVLTNKVPTAAFRGAGRPEAAYILERTINAISQELQLDPAEVRRINYIPTEAFPYTALTGITYDSGNYVAALDKVLELGNYAEWRKKQQAQRQSKDSSKLIGIGLGSYIEIAGGGGPSMPGIPQESATVRVRNDGSVLVQSAVAHNGQGHFTAFTQIAASTFNLPADKVEVQLGSTDLPSYAVGTFGSRTTAVSGSAVLLAAEAARAKTLEVAGRLLEVGTADLTLENGRVMVQGVPGKSIELAELARQVEANETLAGEPEKPNPANGVPVEGLASWRDFNPPNATFPFGSHLAVVEIDTLTGDVEIVKYVAVDDCGNILNEYLAEAQVHGSLAQGIGQALYEEAAYDENGQLISGTLMDYTVPTALELPEFIVDATETPSPTNPLGAKGVGESGCTGAPPTIVNAVLDALAPLGITTIDMPLRPEKIWSLIQEAKAGKLQQPEPQLPPVFHQDQTAKTDSSGKYVFE